MKKLITVSILMLFLSSISFGQGTSKKENDIKKEQVSKPVVTDSTILFCFKDLDIFLGAIQGKVQGKDGTILQLTTKEYFLLLDLLNRSLEPVVQRYSATQQLKTNK